MATVRITRLRMLLLGNREYGSRIPDYEVAGACRIHPSTFASYANGSRTNYLQHHLLALADYFQIDPNEIMGEVDVEVPDAEESTG